MGPGATPTGGKLNREADMKFPKQAADEAGATSINKQVTAEETLRQRNLVSSLERGVERRDGEIEDLTQALDKAQTRISDLEEGFEERMAKCRELRDALKVERERADAAEDQLHQRDNPDSAAPRKPGKSVPSLQDLMDDDSYMKETLVLDEDAEDDIAATSMHAKTLPSLDSELVSAALIFPGDKEDESAQQAGAYPVLRLLEPDDLPSSQVNSGSLDSTFTRTLAIVLDEGTVPIRHPIFKAHVTIGRSSHADIQIASDFVSRVHAHIITNDKGTHIEDVDSKNGVRVNNVRVASRLPIKAGDTVRLGRFEFRVVALA
jgi:hypothetical protein